MVTASSIQSITRAAALGTAAIGVLSSSGLTARADDLGPAIVIDSLGNQIGPYFDAGPYGDVVLRKINGHWFSLSIGREGFLDSPGPNYYQFTTSDCSGTPYLGAGQPLVLRHAATESFVIGGTLYYPNFSAAQTVTICSALQLNPDGTAGQCDSFPAAGFACFTNVNVATVNSLKLSTLAFVPPFDVSVRGVK
jgi:hypothetical protein